MNLNHRAEAIGNVLMDAIGEFVSESILSARTGETGYAVRWYVYQLRRAGFVIEAAKFATPELFRAGVRGFRLMDIVDEPYVPSGRASGDLDLIVTGSRVSHPTHGMGRVTFSDVDRPKVVVKFRRRTERVDREVLALVN